MRKTFLTAALSVVAVGALWPATAGAASQATTTLTLCVSEGAGQLVVEGGHSLVTPQLNVTDPDASGNECISYPVTAGLEYTITAGKYLSAPCYKTVNGDLVNPPVLQSPRVNCEGKVHHVHTGRTGQPTTTIEADEVTVVPRPTTITTVSFHVTDVRYFDCTDDTGSNPTRVCEPEGPTT